MKAPLRGLTLAFIPAQSALSFRQKSARALGLSPGACLNIARKDSVYLSGSLVDYHVAVSKAVLT